MIFSIDQKVKADNLVREGLGSIPARVLQRFIVYLMDAMINDSMACLTLNIVQKSDDQT